VWPAALARAADGSRAGERSERVQGRAAASLLRAHDGAHARLARAPRHHAQRVCRAPSHSLLRPNSLITICSRTTAASYTVFFDAIAAQGRALLRVSLNPADTSLTSPQALLTHAQDLRAILSLYTAEADGDDDGDGDGEAGGSSSSSSEEDSATIERALDALVDPAVKMCVAAAEEKDAALRRRANATAGTTWDRPVFVLNCLTYLVDTLAQHPCAARKRAELDDAVEARVLELIKEHVRVPSSFFPSFSHAQLSPRSRYGMIQYETVLRDSGLHDAVRACEQAPLDVRCPRLLFLPHIPH